MNSELLKEKTYLIHPTFPINVFHNFGRDLFIHWHDHFEIILMVEGDAVFQIGPQSQLAGPGDLIFVNGGQLHSGHSIRNTPLEYYAVVCDWSLFQLLADPHFHAAAAPLRGGEMQFPVILPQHSGAYPAVIRYLRELIEECSSRKSGYEASVKSLLTLMFTAMERDGQFVPREGRGPDKQLLNRFKPLFDYVQEHYADKISVEQAAALVNLSPYHFCREFKRATGRTFVEFLHEQRVNAAEDLIRRTDSPITRIAENVGFGSINYFDRVFKKVKHYPPSAARK